MPTILRDPIPTQTTTSSTTVTSAPRPPSPVSTARTTRTQPTDMQTHHDGFDTTPVNTPAPVSPAAPGVTKAEAEIRKSPASSQAGALSAQLRQHGRSNPEDATFRQRRSSETAKSQCTTGRGSASATGDKPLSSAHHP